MGSGRFAMAVHALALLAQQPEGCSSDLIAGSVNTHPVFLRRLLGQLAAAGLIVAREGRGGGYRLASPAERITLDRVYRAVDEEGPLAPCSSAPNPHCPVGVGMSRTFRALAERARRALEAELALHTVAEMASSALRRGRHEGRA